MFGVGEGYKVWYHVAQKNIQAVEITLVLKS